MIRTAIKSLPQATQRSSCQYTRTVAARAFTTSHQSLSKTSEKDEAHPEKATEQKAQDTAAKQKHTKTQAQLDEELREKMSGLAGDGGESGIEYEDGQPVSMKRSVKNNMFRYI